MRSDVDVELRTAPRVMRGVIATVILAFAFAAWAIVPPDATLLIVSDEGVIVGIGRAESGDRLTLRVMRSYHGFGRLVVIADEGRVSGWDVVLTAGIVLVGFEDLRLVAERAGFGDVAVEPEDVLDLASLPMLRGPWAPGQSGVPAHEPPADAADAAFDGEGSDPAGPADGPGADPQPVAPPGGAPPPVADPAPPSEAPSGPGTPEEPTSAPPAGPPAATPVGPPGGPPGGPPAATPGRPDGPPAHGHGQERGGGAPHDGALPDADDEDDAAPPGRGRGR